MSEFPALEGERYRSIRAKHPADKVTTAEGQPSQREPAYHILEMEGASGHHRREVATTSMPVTPSRISVRVESRDAVEAFGHRGEVTATTELETWPRVPVSSWRHWEALLFQPLTVRDAVISLGIVYASVLCTPIREGGSAILECCRLCRVVRY